MARREMSLLSSSSSSSSSISPESAFSCDFLEYLRFQFSRMVALLSFARIKTNDGKDKNDEANNNDDNQAKPASACDHGLLCRMISSVVDPIIEMKKRVKLDPLSPGNEANDGGKSAQRKNGASIEGNIKSKKGRKDKSRPKNDKGEDEDEDDPFGLTSNRKAKGMT